MVSPCSTWKSWWLSDIDPAPPAHRHGRSPPATGSALSSPARAAAILLREQGWKGPILLLEGFFHADELAVLDQYRLTTVCTRSGIKPSRFIPLFTLR
jgi:hypothetical protein